MEHMHLIGAEDVRAAASNMRQAASEMSNAAATIDGACRRHQQFMEDWLQRFADVLQQATDSFVSVRSPAPTEIVAIEPPPRPGPPAKVCTKSVDCSLSDLHDGPCNDDNIPF